MKCDGYDQIYVLLYDNDVLYFGTYVNLVAQIKKEIKIMDLGIVTDFCGINTKQNIEKGIPELSQRKYLKSVLKLV